MRQPRIRTRGVWAVLVVAAVVLSTAGLLAVAVPLARAPGPSALPPAGAVSGPLAIPVTHGDLVVLAGQTYVIQPSLGGNIYYQGGNITVEAGGTLIVRNVDLSFVQYVANTGTAMQRLSHIYQFSVAGTVEFENSTVTTDVQILNAYAKLDLSVTGTLTAWNTTFAFPGWFAVTGAAAVATLNSSRMTGNPAVPGLSEPSAIQADTMWAPTISVTQGAKLNLFGSQLYETYADNTLAAGAPNPTPLSAAGGALAPLATVNQTVHGPSDSANLTLDWSYPAAGAQSGFVAVQYNNSNSVDAFASVDVWYAGTSYALGSVTLLNGTVGGTVEVPFSGALLGAISAAGMLKYLNYTGDFGVTPGEIAVALTSTSGPAVDLSKLSFQLNVSGPTYDITVAGAGSELSAVDTAIDVNWNSIPVSPYSQSSPFPWNSNKLDFTGGATGYLANISTPSGIAGVFSTSAVVPDAASQVYFYRWAEFNLTGRAGAFPVEGATGSAYYAYDSNQANNATANALNAVATANPAIWGYLQFWDAQHGIASYATSNAQGQLFLLLAAGNLTGPTLPDGIFLGGYHIGISVPAASVGSHWFNWSVSPYPTGVANFTTNFQAPDGGPAQTFTNYFGAATYTVQVTANGTADPTGSIRIGQELGFWVTATDAGTATLHSISATLYYNSTQATLLGSTQLSGLNLNALGQSVQFNVSWNVTDAVTGLHGTFSQLFFLELQWNGGVASQAGGSAPTTVNVTVHPSQIRVVSATTTAPTTIDLNQQYFTSGTIQYNGTQKALILLYAVPTSGAAPVELGYAYALSGQQFTIDWGSPLNAYLSTGTSYQLEVTASYNGVTSASYYLPGTYTVPSPTSPASNFFTQVFFGLPFWAWLAIAAAIVVGLVLFLLLARRTAAGKLVECGECGNLIPEDATVCPKCGAEFEADLIRCSRCASTIPAESKYCPECAAQLLGKPGEGGEEAERQGYADFTEKYRAEAKRELGENYSEGAFWDWWKRQPSYTSYGQWKLQQGQGTPRTGMTAPPSSGAVAPEAAPPSPPPRRGAGGAAAEAAPAPTSAAPPPPPAPGAGAAGLKPCPNCGKEIPPEYLVCPFCGAVTQ